MASKQLAGFGKELGGMGAAGKVAAVGIAGVASAGLGLVAGIGAALGQAMDFESAMSAVAAVAGGTDADLKRLSDTALQLGQDTTLSGVGATEAALAMRELAAAGLTVDEIVGGAALGALRLASAGGIDVARASEIAAMALANFGLEGDQAARVADLFAGAANSSAISVDDIAEAMKYVGPIANSMGLSIEEVTATIAALGNQGIKSSQAGTSLRSMLVNLAKPSKEAAKVIRDLGLEFFDANGQMRGLADISEELQSGMAGLTDQQRAAALATLFGNEALTAATVLYGEGAEGINKWLKEVTTGASAAEVGAKRNDNLRGSLEALKGAAQTATIAFGVGLTPALKGLALNFAGAVSAAVPFLTLLGAGLGRALTAGIAVLQQFGGYLTGIVTALVGAFRRLQAGEITLAQFIGGVKTLIATVLGDIRTLLADAATLVAPYLARIGAAIVAALPIIGAELLKLAQAFGSWVTTTAIPFLQTNLPIWLGTLTTWLTTTALPVLATAAGLLAGALGGWLTATAIPYLQTNLPIWGAALWDWITNTAVPTVTGRVLGLANALTDWITVTAVPYLNEKLPQWGAALWDWITNTAVPTVVGRVVALANALGNWVTEQAIPFLQAKLPEWGAALWGYITDTVVPTVKGKVIGVANAMSDWVQDTAIPQIEADLPGWTAAINNTLDTASKAADTGTEAIADIMGNFIGQKVLPALTADLGKTALVMVAWFPAVIIAFAQFSTQIGTQVGKWFGADQQATLRSNLAAFGNAVSSWILTMTFILPILGWKMGTAIGQKIAEGLGEKIGEIRQKISSLGPIITGGLAVIAGIVSPAAAAIGSAIINGIAGALSAGAGKLAGIASSVVNDALAAAKGVLGIKSPSKEFAIVGNEIINGLVKGMGDKEQEATKKAAEVASAVAKAVTDVLAASRALAGFKSGDAPSGEQLAWFAEMVDAMLGTMSAVAGRFEAKALEHTDKFADTLGKVGGAIKNAVEGLLLLGKTDWANASPDGHALAWFAHLAASLVANFAEAAMRFESGAIESASAFADAAGKVGGSVANALGGLQALARADWASSSPDGHAMAWFTHLIASLVRNFADAAATFGEGALASANAFAETAGKVGGAVSGALAGLKALASASWAESSPDGSAMGWFTHLVASLVRNFADAARLFESDALASASAFAEAVGAVTGSIAGAIAGLAALDDFVAPVEGRVSAFMVTLADLMERFGTWASGFESDSLAHSTLFAEAAGTVTGILKGGVEGLTGLAKFVAPAEADVSAFMASIADLVERFGTWAGGFEADALGHAATFAESAGKVVGILKPGVDGLAAIATLVAPSEAAVERFLAGIRYVIGRFAAMATILDTEGVAHMGAFSEAAGKALGAAKAGTDLFLGFKDLVIPSAEAIDALMEGIKYVVRRFHEMAGTLDSEGVPQLAAFAESAGKALGAAKAGTDLFNGMKDLAIPSSKAIDNLLLGIAYVIQKTREIAANIGTEGLREAQIFANGAGEVFAAIKGGLQSFEDMAEYEGIPKAALEGAWNALTAALEWARKNVTLATSLKGEGQKFRDEMAAAARLFAEGLSLSAGATAPGGGAGWTYAPGAPGGGGGGKTSNVTVNNPILLGRDSIVTQKLANLVTAGQNKVVGYSV